MLSLRPVSPSDLSVLATLLAQIDNETPATIEAMQRVLNSIARYPHYNVYLVCNEDEPVATFSLLIFPTVAHGGRPEALMEAVVVRPDLRGQGIGREMMKLAMDKAREAGAYKLALSSNAKRLDAHRFYQGLGMTQHGISFSIEV